MHGLIQRFSSLLQNHIMQRSRNKGNFYWILIIQRVLQNWIINQKTSSIKKRSSLRKLTFFSKRSKCRWRAKLANCFYCRTFSGCFCRLVDRHILYSSQPTVFWHASDLVRLVDLGQCVSLVRFNRRRWWNSRHSDTGFYLIDNKFLLLCLDYPEHLPGPSVLNYKISFRLHIAGHPGQSRALCSCGHQCSSPPAKGHCHCHIFRRRGRRSFCYRGRIDFSGSAVLGIIPWNIHHVSAGGLVYVCRSRFGRRYYCFSADLCRYLYRILDPYSGSHFNFADFLHTRRHHGI